MKVEFAQKITERKFFYHLTGFRLNLIYDAMNTNLVLADVETGVPVSITEVKEMLTFDDFIQVAKNVMTEIVMRSN